MDQTTHVLATANMLYARANSTTTTNPEDANRPPVYKAIGISLAIASGVFIGVSFVLKKVGLLKANVKYEEAAGEGYGYLKNAFWWSGMILMVIGEICNFVAYAFVDAILVTPLGALSVVITTILSAIFLKERLSMVGKVGCFLCIIGSVVIVMNAPSESSAANIQEMQNFVIAPGFLSYAGIIVIGCAFIGSWVAPRYGKKSMLVYLSICSLIGGLSVVATQGLGAAIVAEIGGTPQFNRWFLYVLFVFVVITLVTEIIYLNKALNLFNAALVTPTYYVFFTSSTIITSAILFRGFKGTVTSIITVVMGFFVICAGVVLLQLSKSAKDVPDTAVFAGDLDQVRTIAEQEQPETEQKADAIRGTAAIVRIISTTRQKKELEEARRLHEEKQKDLEPLGEGEYIQWDGLRRRRTTLGTHTSSVPSRHNTILSFPDLHPLGSPVQHPPLGMSSLPSNFDSDDENDASHGSTFLGSISNRAKSVIGSRSRSSTQPIQSPMQPEPLTEITIPNSKTSDDVHDVLGVDHANSPYLERKTEYQGTDARHVIPDDQGSNSNNINLISGVPSQPGRRQFSFQQVFCLGQPAAQTRTRLSEDQLIRSRSPIIRKGLSRRSDSTPAAKTLSLVKGATEEEALGLVKGDTNISTQKTALPIYEAEKKNEGEGISCDSCVDDKSGELEEVESTEKDLTRDGRGTAEMDKEAEVGIVSRSEEEEYYEQQRQKWNTARDSGANANVGGGAAARLFI